MSIQIGAKRAKMCMQCVHIPNQLPFCTSPLVVGKVQSTSDNQNRSEREEDGPVSQLFEFFVCLLNRVT